jgi:AcrR family transcriptional regulator
MSRGRPRQFDTDHALDQALRVFWRKGYGGASLVDLTTAMDISGPSLYAAYGDKQSLFLQCVERYLTVYGKEPLRRLEQTPSVADALVAFFRAIVDNVAGTGTPRGCLVVCALADCALDNEAVGRQLAECIRRTDALICSRLQRARAEGDLPDDVDVAQLAALTNSLRHGLALRARAGESRKSLLAFADAASALVVPRRS